MAIYETLKLWAVLSPCQQRAKAETDVVGGKQEELEGEHGSRAMEFCHPPSGNVVADRSREPEGRS